MKARIKGSNEPFREIDGICIDDWNLVRIEKVEFEQQQEPISDHWQDVRERAAIAAIQAFCAAPVTKDTESITLDEAAKFAVEIADALVKKLKGE